MHNNYHCSLHHPQRALSPYLKKSCGVRSQCPLHSHATQSFQCLPPSHSNFDNTTVLPLGLKNIFTCLTSISINKKQLYERVKGIFNSDIEYLFVFVNQLILTSHSQLTPWLLIYHFLSTTNCLSQQPPWCLLKHTVMGSSLGRISLFIYITLFYDSSSFLILL